MHVPFVKQIPYELLVGCCRYTRANRFTSRNGFMSFVSGLSIQEPLEYLESSLKCNASKTKS